jgi:hemolysin activation/secretion protein
MLSPVKSVKFYLLAIITGVSCLSFNSSTLAESDTQLQLLPVTEISQDEEKSKRMQRLLAVLRNNAEISLFATQTDQGDKQPKQILTPLKAENSLDKVPETQAANLTAIASQTAVKIRQVQVLGNTAFSKSEINKVVEPFVGKQANFEQLLAIRAAVTDFYTSSGYTTSGAFLPPQDVSGGVVSVQVVEGELEKIEVKGLTRLRENYVRSRISLAAGTPINLGRLETALQVLQLDPLFDSVQAEMKAGTTPGRSILSLTLKEARPFRSGFTVENRDSPSVGSIRGSSNFSYQNLLGLGDRFSGDIGYTSGAKSYDLSYAVPLNARNGTLSLRYADSNSRVIEAPFSPLDILGRTKTFSLGFRQPIVNTPKSEFALSLSADLRESQTFLLENIPFSFSTGPENGKSRVTVLRFGQDWINRTPKRVLAARSQFSLGIGAFDATVNNSFVDGRFFSWIGQFQWVQNMGKDVVGVARFATQLSPDSLLPLEQFSIGGIDTIRGYRQNQFVADNGVTGSFEVRFGVVNDPGGFGTIQVAPFVDVGKVWNNNGTGVDNRLFAGTGLSLRWQYDNFAARLDWGLPLTSITRQGDSLQDNGLFFSLIYQPF